MMSVRLILFILTAVQHLTAGPEINTLINEGQLELAEQYINQSLEIESHTIEEQAELNAFHGDIWFYRQNFERAQKLYLRALKLIENSDHFRLQADQQKNIAITFSELSDYGAALMWHEKALNTLSENNNTDDSVVQIELSVLLSQGMIFASVGAPELAMETLSHAQNLAYTLGKSQVLNNVYLRLAALHFDNKRYDLSTDALAAVDLTSMTDLSDLSWYYGLKFNTLLASHDWQQAELLWDEIFEHPIQWPHTFLEEMKVLRIELSLSKNQMQKAKTMLDELIHSEAHHESWLTAHLMASWYAKKNDHVQAMKYHKMAIGHFLEEIKSRKNQKAIVKVPVSLFSSAIKTAYLTAYTDDFVVFNWLQWLVQNKQLVNLQASDKKKNPAEPNTDGEIEVVSDIVNNHFLSLAESYDLPALQSVLRGGEGVLFYVVVDNELMVFLIQKDRFEFAKLSTAYTTVKNKVVEFINKTQQQGDAWQPAAVELEGILLKPLRGMGLDQLTHLHIIPDDNLRFMPFELLLDEQGLMAIDRFQLVFNTFDGLSQLIKHRNNRLNKPEKVTRLSFIGTSNDLPTLPNYWRTAYRNLAFVTKGYQGIEAEQKLISDMNLPGQHYFSHFATESKAIEMITQESGILHLSSHGFDNPVAPAFSALVLNNDIHTDGLLQAREVMALHSNLSMVILASCSSAKGGLAGRYGSQLGLADAFIKSGSQAVIGTLWDVKDQSTAQFMTWFYEKLSQTHVPAIALKETKLKARSLGWQAHDWAAFVMLGDNSTAVKMKPINIRDYQGLTYWVLATLIVIFLIVMISAYLKVKSNRIT